MAQREASPLEYTTAETTKTQNKTAQLRFRRRKRAGLILRESWDTTSSGVNIL